MIFGKTFFLVIASIGLLAPVRLQPPPLSLCVSWSTRSQVLAAPIPQASDTDALDSDGLSVEQEIDNARAAPPLADGDHGNGVIIFQGHDIGQAGDVLVGDNIVSEDGEVTSEQDVADGITNLATVQGAT
jgi:hypothetical protein